MKTSTSLADRLTAKQKTYAAVLVAALGYFVDVFDIALFTIVRVESLKSLGLQGDELLDTGVYLLNWQMGGMLLGGILWGILGDKRGRVQVLFGSILLYSLANIANAFVTSIEAYAVLRFLAGIGLAGEIGAGITLVSELMPKETRGYATTIVASVGVSGALAAALVGDLFHWRTAYIIGGVMGLVLLLLRVSVSESGLFNSLRTEQQHVARGDLRLLLGTRGCLFRYLSCILVGLPVWFIVGIMITFSPEIGAALGIVEPIKTAHSVLYYSVGITLGDVLSGVISQLWRSRKKVLMLFVCCTLAVSLIVLNSQGVTARFFYAMCFPMGFFVGYWAVFVTTASEQFGTNLRATVTTTVPNVVRGSTVLMTLLFNELKPSLGVIGSAEVVGLLACGLSLLALYFMRETFGVDLNFLEGKGDRDSSKASQYSRAA